MAGVRLPGTKVKPRSTSSSGALANLPKKEADEKVWKPLRHGHLLSSKGEGLEELHFEVRTGHR